MNSNNTHISIIMYHYVREIRKSAYPQIKGLEAEKFARQLDLLKSHYNPVTMQELIDAVHNNGSLPPNALLLTFDDGYSDHYQYVLPELLNKNLQGSFFPPARAIQERKVLDVNKIHFILACAPSVPELLKEVSDQLSRYRTEYNLASDTELFKKLAVASALDTKEVIFIKRLLQVELPHAARQLITGNLFRKFVSESEEDFCAELYMSIDQIKALKQAGMHIGSHGYTHEWLGTLTEPQQRADVQKGMEFLELTGTDMENWTMSYPFGSYNQTLLAILKEYNCKLAFKSLPPGIANLSIHHKYELPRIDTVDIPFD